MNQKYKIHLLIIVLTLGTISFFVTARAGSGGGSPQGVPCSSYDEGHTTDYPIMSVKLAYNGEHQYMTDFTEFSNYHQGIYYHGIPQEQYLYNLSQIMTPANDQLSDEKKGYISVNISSPKCAGSVVKKFTTYQSVNNNTLRGFPIIDNTGMEEISVTFVIKTMLSSYNRVRIAWTKSVAGQYNTETLIAAGKIMTLETKGFFTNDETSSGGGGGGYDFNPTLDRDLYIDGRYQTDKTVPMVAPSR